MKKINNKQIIALIISFFAALMFAVFTPQIAAQSSEPEPEPSPSRVEEPIKKEWTFETLVPYLAEKHGVDEQLAREIIRCESRNKKDAKGYNYNSEGKVWSTDIGYFQVNSYYHTKEALSRGFDIYVWEENLEYGFIMLKEQGVTPWEPSKKCWNNNV